MNSATLFHIMFFSIFALVIGSLVFKVIKHGGLKAAMFGAPIENTLGEVAGSTSNFVKLALRVHRLGGDPSDRIVGLEFVAKSFGSYQMMPIALSRSEAQRLSQLLQAALAGRGASQG